MLRIAAITGLLAVGLGAFGAHGLEPILEKNGTADVWKTASLYHLVHAVVLLILAFHSKPFVWSFRCFAVGILIFSGSLYVLALSNLKWLGAITPLGGLALIVGWFLLCFPGKRA
jgi:uncharacterized membrane protein YgdD (TMEM256/DUF423 family)